jgi:hypothetical protein
VVAEFVRKPHCKHFANQSLIGEDWSGGRGNMMRHRRARPAGSNHKARLRKMPFAQDRESDELMT